MSFGSLATRARLLARVLTRDLDHRGADDLALEPVTGSHRLRHVRIDGAFVVQDGFVLVRIERLAARLDALEPRLLEDRQQLGVDALDSVEELVDLGSASSTMGRSLFAGVPGSRSLAAGDRVEGALER